MANQSGFGKAQPKPKASKRSQERASAAQQYEKMKADGTPDFEVYIRIRDKKPWYPVGVLAVKRSSQINQAIFDSQAQLLQGAFRLFPILKKNQNQLEYGYRLKAFKDDPIQLAVPTPATPVSGIQNAIAALGDSIAAVFRRWR